MSRLPLFFVVAICLCVLASACGGSATPTVAPTLIAQTGSRPSLTVSAPIEGALFSQGSIVSVQSTAADARGIVRIELWVDGVLYRVDVTKEGEALPNVSITQTWPANELGNHVLLLKAVNRDGAASEPQTINIGIVPAGAVGSASPAATRAPTPTTPTTAVPQTTPTAPSAPSTTPGCDNDAAFVSDVTIPDGTTFKFGEPINKVWRVRNSGACAWEAGYQLAFASGAQMDASNAVAVPRTAPGATADIAVAMTAPRAAGAYTGKWRLRAPTGALFGQSVSIVIRVVDPNPPTPTPTTTPGALAVDFTASRSSIPYGDCVTLKWDVDNAQAVKLMIGTGNLQGVAGHDTRLVCPTTTTDYTLQVIPNPPGDIIQRDLTVTVQEPTKAASASIGAGDTVDLDTGIKNTGNVDFLWEASKTFTPKNGATFVRIGIRGYNEVQQAECLNNTGYSAASLGGGQVAVGSLICFKTNGGRNGKLRIEGLDDGLTFRWVTW